MRLSIRGSVGKVLGNVQHAVGKGVKDTGHAVGDAMNNKYVQAATAAALTATGVGAPAAAAILAAQHATGGALHRGGGLHDAAIGAATGAIEGGGAGLLGHAVRAVPGVSAVGNRLAQLPGVGAVTQLGQRVKAAIPSVPGAGILGNIKDEAGRAVRRVAGGNNPIALGPSEPAGTPSTGAGGRSWLDKLLMGGTIAAGTADELDRRKLRNQAQNYAQQSYDARAPLRARALTQLQNPTTPDYSSIFADSGNPYSQQRRAQALMGAA